MSDITKTEAIERLKDLDDIVGLDAYGRKAITIDIEDIKAIRMARASLETDEAYQLEYEQPEICENCIDRDYTTKYVEEFANNEYVSKDEAETIYLIADGIRHIPSVLPKVRKGHWICNGKGRSFADYHCSECGLKLALCGQDIKQRQDSGYSLFCGGCGADMREVEENE